MILSTIVFHFLSVKLEVPQWHKIYAVERTMVIESLTLVLSVHGNVHWYCPSRLSRLEIHVWFFWTIQLPWQLYAVQSWLLNVRSFIVMVQYKPHTPKNKSRLSACLLTSDWVTVALFIIWDYIMCIQWRQQQPLQ